MRRLAVFTEGLTEVYFVEKLISEIAGAHRVAIQHQQVLGGATVPRMMRVIRAAKLESAAEYYVLIVDCGGDHQVKPRIIEEHKRLTDAGYSKIIGLRDVRPDTSHAEIPQLELNLRKYVRTSLTPVEFILAAMEIEAWFLAEHTHYPKIDPAITVDTIRAQLGFDVMQDDLSVRPTPQEDLTNAYQIGGRTYAKPGTQTIDSLDYAYIYSDLSQRIPYMRRLVQCIDTFLS